jgi:hypothetical protein
MKKKSVLLISLGIIFLLVILFGAYYYKVAVPYNNLIEKYTRLTHAERSLIMELYLYDDFRSAASSDPEKWTDSERKKNGKFNLEIRLLERDWYLHILNYNRSAKQVPGYVFFLGDRLVSRMDPRTLCPQRITELSEEDFRMLKESIVNRPIKYGVVLGLKRKID